ncbi:MAG: BrnA antitoxin family protein [Sphingomonadaceae bacterium]
MKNKRELIWPTPQEDAAITAAALADPDAQPLTDEQLAQMRPWRTMGCSSRVGVDVGFDRDVVEAFQATGEDWRKRMNDALREWALQHQLLPPPDGR